jgi:type VI secretion system VgrG family protein
MELTDQPLCSFSSTALPLDALQVFSWRGEEAMSRPYRFDIRVATCDPLLDDEVMLGKPATLTLFDAQGVPQPYHGVVTEVEQLDSDDRYFYSRVVLEPRMALLRQHRFSEIWLDKTLPELVRAVLKETGLLREGPGVQDGIGGDYDFDIRLASDDLALSPVTFTCQFEETSFAYLSRLLEYYGVYYFFEQQADQEALVLCGDLRYQPQVSMPVNYRPLDRALDVDISGAVTRTFTRHVVSQARQVVLQDFSASDAQLQLQASASIASASLTSTAADERSTTAQTSLAFQGNYGVYGEHFGSNREGQWLATRRAQAIGCRHREFHGTGRASGLRAGFPMQLLSHPRLPLNTTYQVIEVWHDGSQPLPGLGEGPSEGTGDCNTRFIALPGDVQFRAPCITPRPCVQGQLSAVIDGDDDTDQPLLNKHGCYKVRFPFVRSEKTATRGSAWVRMASLSSGASHGMHFPLLKGTEVLVSFIGGDPDRPIITGSVPNSENPNKVNSANATQSGVSSPGGHYLAMDDNPSGGLMKMGAPVGNATFTLGKGHVSGASLTTDAHMQLSSSSHKQTVGGIYSLTIGSESNAGAGEQPVEHAKPKESAPGPLELAGVWGGPSKGNFGARVNWTNSRTVSVELRTAAEEVDASAGLSKQLLTARGSTLEVHVGVKSEFGLHPGTRAFKAGFTGVTAAWLEKALSKKEENVVLQQLSATHSVQTGTYKLDAVSLLSIQCGNHSITLTPAGIVVESSDVVTFKSDLRVTGKLTVEDKVFCAADCAVQGEFKAGVSVQAPEMKTVTLKAGKADLAYPVTAVVLTGEQFQKAAMATKAKVQQASEVVGKTVHKAALELSKAVQTKLKQD